MQIGMSVIVTIISYSLFPLLFANFRRSPITSTRYRVYCFLFNFVLDVLLTTLGVFAARSNIYPMLIWTFIVTIFGKQILTSHNVLSN